MKQNKAFKFKLLPNTAQRDLLNQTFGCVRFVYNYMLNREITNHQQGGKFLSYNTLAKELPVLKQQYCFLKTVDSIALQIAIKNMTVAFKNFFNKKTGYPKFKSKKFSKKSYSTNCVNNNITIENSSIKLPKLGFVKMKQHRQIPSDYIIKSVTISKNASGNYFVSILFEFDNNIINVEPNKAVGLDFSANNLFVSSDGDVAHYPNFYKITLEELAKAQRKLSHCQYKSNNYFKQKNKVNKLHEHIANQRKDFLHKLSKQIANVYDVVCIETLDIKSITSKNTKYHLGKSVLDDGWGMFTTFLEYKLIDRGKYFVKVDKFFPSSQLCHICNYQNPDTKDLSVRNWQCPNCHSILDRDINAAINIKNEGLRSLGLL